MEDRRVVVLALGCCLALSSGCGVVAGPESSSQVQRAGEPPPISGGTLLVQKDGNTAVAADPDRDRVWIVDLAHRTVLHQVELQPGDEPGRVAEDASGRVHVVLRHGGALVSIDPRTGAVTARRPVCPAPRGVAYDAAVDGLHVACADGRLVTFPSGGGAAVRTVQLDSDLRDVVVEGGKLYVSRFRAAELLEVASNGSIAQRITPPLAASMSPGPNGPTAAVPSVAWRTVATPWGAVAMLHQRARVEAVSTEPGGYASFGTCPGAGIVQGAVTIVTPGTAPSVGPALASMTLAVDMAVSVDGSHIAIAAPGALGGPGAVTSYDLSTVLDSPCLSPSPAVDVGQAAATAVAFDGQGRVVAQTREPAAICVGGSVIALPGESVASAGHAIFHTAASPKGGIACASCHPEGGDDGQVWQFVGLGPRRTQNLRGGVLARAPFHWTGDIPGMDQLVTQVFVGRMGGAPLGADQVAALGQWMDAQPALAPPLPADAAAVQRGGQIFDDPSVGCATCHSGPQRSTHALVDVGTGGAFKVPSLIAIGYRAPYLHDGCAATLRDRFGGTCGGGARHGNTEQLDGGQIDDLIAYLQSL